MCVDFTAILVENFSNGAIVRRILLHKIPNIVPLGGVFLSVLLAILSWKIGAVNAVESVILGLIGTILSIQFAILVRHEEHYEFAELLAGPSWLRESIKNLAADGAIISTVFRDTPIEDEARHLLQGFRADFSNLRLGRLRRGPEDSHYLIQHTRDAKSEILAVTNVGQGIGSPHWWREGAGRAYLKENTAAVQRGVSIQRIVIYSENQYDDALEFAKEQHEAGVQVKLTSRETLRPERRINFAIWDARISWEAQMNADGNPIATIYCVEATEIRRLTEVHRALWTNSSCYTPSVSPGRYDSPAAEVSQPPPMRGASWRTCSSGQSMPQVYTPSSVKRSTGICQGPARHPHGSAQGATPH
jgi:hypothetical protein